MTDEQILRIAAKHDIDEYLPEALTIEFARAILAAGASEGQAEPIYQARMGFYNWMDIDKERYDNFTLNGHPDNYRIVYTRPLLEIKTMSMTVEEALQRAADLEKQGCITPTAQALLALAKAYQEVVQESMKRG